MPRCRHYAVDSAARRWRRVCSRACCVQLGRAAGQRLDWRVCLKRPAVHFSSCIYISVHAKTVRRRRLLWRESDHSLQKKSCTNTHNKSN